MLALKLDHNNDTLVVSPSTSSRLTKSLTDSLLLSLVFKVFYLNFQVGLLVPDCY